MALRGFTWGVKPRSGAPRPIDPLRRPVSTGAAGGGPTIGDLFELRGVHIALPWLAAASKRCRIDTVDSSSVLDAIVEMTSRLSTCTSTSEESDDKAGREADPSTSGTDQGAHRGTRGRGTQRARRSSESCARGARRDAPGEVDFVDVVLLWAVLAGHGVSLSRGPPQDALLIVNRTPATTDKREWCRSRAHRVPDRSGTRLCFASRLRYSRSSYLR
jgi:hypothetical protein